jgi:hypothetical protein
MRPPAFSQDGFSKAEAATANDLAGEIRIHERDKLQSRLQMDQSTKDSWRANP